ncbi:MAG TPA: cbb3-type cytochrome c oxidase subunit I [Candidatus Paceibacterota bacterium]|nr:cbb3-type cytochrome c oxidase subunit I [Candidatus Paceibacterota bacterium]
MTHFIFGNLTWSDLPHQWFTIGGTVALVGIAAAGIGLLTYLHRWRWLWKNWLTSTDPKKIGVMYIVVAAAMFFRGGLDAIMIWLQQALSSGQSQGYLDASHFQQIFTAHGDIMVFFATMGFLFGLMNLIVPLEIGARDLAFPFLNSLGFWLYVAGAILINMFFVFGGEFASAGWLSLPPLSEIAYSPGTGVDYWIWSLQISGLGSLLGGLNFLVTIFRMRAPGMTLMKMPMFVWTSLCSSVLIVSTFPVLTVTTALLWLDRFFGMHFFSSGFGGNPMMYVNLIWMWGHPEVYILVLPSFGIFSEVVSAFSHKRLFGYVSMVLAAICVTLLACLVWLHHFFTMGAGADVNAFFGISTMLIAIPAGVQIFNWISTMFRGRIVFATPMYWFLGFVTLFTFGGMAGVLLASPAADYQLHNTLFLVAHFHTMIVGAGLFGIFAGITYWAPKVLGFKLDEKWGKRAFWLWLAGFLTAFTPLYILGAMGATRRLDHYAAATGYQPLFIVAGIGGCLIAAGFITQIVQVVVSVKERKQNLDTTGDPWDARTLEWSTPSPVPFYNFAAIPTVHSRDAWWASKEAQKQIGERPGSLGSLSRQNVLLSASGRSYEDIELPKNTAMAIYVSVLVFLFGFAMVWHIFWLAALGLGGAIACVIIRSFDEHTEYILTAAEVERMETARK